MRREVWFLQAGLARRQCVGSDGRRQILNLVLPGEMVGIGAREATQSSVETCTRAVLHRFDRRVFDRAMDADPEFRRLIMAHEDRRLERLRVLVWMIGVLTPPERICAFLALATAYMPVRRMPDGSLMIQLVLPRADIADLLRTSVETISRVTRRLHGDGIIEIVDPRQFRIVDRDRLERAGCIGQRLFESVGLQPQGRPQLPATSDAISA